MENLKEEDNTNPLPDTTNQPQDKYSNIKQNSDNEANPPINPVAAEGEVKKEEVAEKEAPLEQLEEKKEEINEEDNKVLEERGKR